MNISTHYVNMVSIECTYWIVWLKVPIKGTYYSVYLAS